MINEQIEDICYCNTDVFEVNNYHPEQTFSSVDIFRYTFSRKDLLKTYYDIHLTVNKYLRKECSELSKECSKFLPEFTEFVGNSPTLSCSFTAWRGLSIPLKVKEGDILDNLGFMWCSLDKNTFYTNDTSKCYVANKIDITRIEPASGTILQITVKPGTHLLDVSYYDHMFQCVTSELILDRNIRLKIEKVSKQWRPPTTIVNRLIPGSDISFIEASVI